VTATAAGQRIRVVLADDQALVRGGFRLVLENDPGITVVGEAGDGVEAVDVVVQRRPAVVLMDIRMPRLDGIEATRRIIDRLGEDSPRIVALTTFELDEYIFDALQAGASGFLLKDIEPDDLRQAVRAVAAGGALLSPTVTRRVIARVAETAWPEPVAPERLGWLTDREREVLALVAEGCNNTEIGQRLYISQATAKTHVSRVMTKLHARDRAQLVVIAYQTGLVGRPTPPG
jgi:DNA-binding NarL/FixJ family response regulator